jgi:hypothetical protein
MRSDEIIRREIDRRDLENAEEAQFAALLYVEEGKDLPIWLEEKILKRCRKFGFRFGEVMGMIASSRITAAEYGKSASRQSTAERAQISNFVKNGVPVEKLSSTGGAAYRFHKGNLVQGSMGDTARTTKALDARHGNDFMAIKF